jgi:hypothetical protein
MRWYSRRNHRLNAAASHHGKARRYPQERPNDSVCGTCWPEQAEDVDRREGGKVYRTRDDSPGPQFASQGDQVLQSDVGHGCDTVGDGHAGAGEAHFRFWTSSTRTS